ncbi:lytic transglycosylase domain-containing protein [Bdellovibrio sp. HCB337]|uniref:lytic transglycosylase domain-containing protein n=1 Tax=Bdellovibrio sp. HCB337 TaxID=3394358 RepID=UPI0039A6F10F
MRYFLTISFLFVAACSSAPRRPASVPSDAWTLEHALQQGTSPTVAYLKAKTTAQAYPELNSAEPFAQIPQSLRASRPAPLSEDKKTQQRYLRQYRAWNTGKKVHRAQELVADFTCEKVIETQTLGFSLEIDFPAEDARAASQSLHEKVLTCEAFPRQESFFRLAIFSIQKNECPKAMEYLNKFPASLEKGVSDRLAYIRSLCSENKDVVTRNPWSGYGILLEDKNKSKEQTGWFLSATSGQEEWDRLLVSFIELTEQGLSNTIQYIAGRLDYEKFRALPVAFQTSMLVLMSNAGADLPVFQILHRYIADHPDMVSPSVTELLFPTRYWDEIVGNTKSADPVLVKALIRQESAFNPSARSRAKAGGLMQLIYPTARIFGMRQRTQLFTPEDNIRAGSQFLGRLIEQFGSVELALAAYNAGPENVRQWQKRYPTENINLFVEMIPYSETREYVRLVNRNYKIYQSRLIKPTIMTQSTGAESFQRLQP